MARRMQRCENAWSLGPGARRANSAHKRHSGPECARLKTLENGRTPVSEVYSEASLATQWNLIVSSKVNLPHTIDLGPYVLQIWSHDTLELRWDETRVLQRVTA